MNMAGQRSYNQVHTGQSSSDGVIITGHSTQSPEYYNNRCRSTGMNFGRERACKKLRVHVVTPSVNNEMLPAPKYRDAIQAVTAANTVLGLDCEYRSPRALTHHQTQTEPHREQCSTQTVFQTDACTDVSCDPCEPSPPALQPGVPCSPRPRCAVDPRCHREQTQCCITTSPCRQQYSYAPHRGSACHSVISGSPRYMFDDIPVCPPPPPPPPPAPWKRGYSQTPYACSGNRVDPPALESIGLFPPPAYIPDFPPAPFGCNYLPEPQFVPQPPLMPVLPPPLPFCVPGPSVKPQKEKVSGSVSVLNNPQDSSGADTDARAAKANNGGESVEIRLNDHKRIVSEVVSRVMEKLSMEEPSTASGRSEKKKRGKTKRVRNNQSVREQNKSLSETLKPPKKVLSDTEDSDYREQANTNNNESLTSCNDQGDNSQSSLTCSYIAEDSLHLHSQKEKQNDIRLLKEKRDHLLDQIRNLDEKIGSSRNLSEDS